MGRGIGDVIDVRQWALTLPTGTPGHPDRVSGPGLGTASGPGFRFDPARGGIVFRVNAGPVSASGRSPRAELREMIGGAPAAWSAISGVHTFTVCQAVTRLPVGQPRVVTAQLHDAHHAVLQISLEDTRLILVDGTGRKRWVLDPHYTLATPYRVTLIAAHGRIEVGYNGHHAGTIIESGSGWYATTGAQLPSARSAAGRGERAEATGEVILYAATLRHDPPNLPEAGK
jgi:hypothetical protein